MKIFLSKINESWIVDRMRSDWYEYNDKISTENISSSNIIWIISPWLWKKIPKRYLKSKNVVCSIYHIDFESFGKKERGEFFERDKYVDFYHVISLKTKAQLKGLTDKKIISIPLWINQNNWFHIEKKDNLRNEFNFNKSDYLIGSFQRDTEGHDLISPKLIKGPDIFLDIVEEICNSNKNAKVILAGNRRNYLINNFKNKGIPYAYFEMVDLPTLNKLYNILDIYIVSSRVEGGPQAIVECSLTKTPIVSTDVGVAAEILHPESIFAEGEFKAALANVDYAYKNSQKYKIPEGMNDYVKMFKDHYEN
ncbi:MAG: glycosyltransferase [Rhizobiales bacterium TMED94]|jgi:hypothetical protein|nr:MAG: glycosyltransferase [Rhizobiales bacterium TMED94]|tara:strand:+ start:1706 stop:2629 length:924 start_codon:yes stop_codon:yes gene_type:complete